MKEDVLLTCAARAPYRQAGVCPDIIHHPQLTPNGRLSKQTAFRTRARTSPIVMSLKLGLCRVVPFFLLLFLSSLNGERDLTLGREVRYLNLFGN